MDFQLSDEQVLLRDTTRDLLSRSYDPESRIKIVGTDLGWSSEVWTSTGRHRDSRTGIRPRRGRAARGDNVFLTGSRTPTGARTRRACGAGTGEIIAEVGSDAQKQLLDEVADGHRLLAFAHLEPGHAPCPPRVIATTAVQQGDSWVLSGRKNPVLASDSAETLVSARSCPAAELGCSSSTARP